MNDNSHEETASLSQPGKRSYVKTLCPVCGGYLEFPAHWLGATTSCHHCQNDIELSDSKPAPVVENKPQEPKDDDDSPPLDWQNFFRPFGLLALILCVGAAIGGLLVMSGDHVGGATFLVLVIVAAALIGSQMKRDKEEN